MSPEEIFNPDKLEFKPDLGTAKTAEEVVNEKVQLENAKVAAPSDIHVSESENKGTPPASAERQREVLITTTQNPTPGVVTRVNLLEDDEHNRLLKELTDSMKNRPESIIGLRDVYWTKLEEYRQYVKSFEV